MAKDEEEEKIQVCPFCHGEVKEIGDLTHCSEGCGCIEGEDDFFMTREQLEDEE